jgi:hypothetical protein
MSLKVQYTTFWETIASCVRLHTHVYNYTCDSYYTGKKSAQKIPILYMHSILGQLNKVFIHSITMYRIRRFLAVLRSFFHSSLLYIFFPAALFHPLFLHPPSLATYFLVYVCLVVSRFMYNTLLGILFPSTLCTWPNQHKLCNLIVSVTVEFFNSFINFFIS